MRLASIDIGTNTVLLLVGDVDNQGNIKPLAFEQRLPRLGKDVDKSRVIQIAAFDKIAWILSEYKNLAKQLRAERIVACATSAVRDASNKDDFLSYVKSVTGIDVEVLSGEDEALWTYRGAVSGFPEIADRAVVIDIGGGSTEISFYSEGRLQRYSFQLGSVRITERYFKHNPPTQEEIDEAVNFVRCEFAPLKKHDFSGCTLVAVAGTATTLACLDQHLTDFEVVKVSGYEMGRERVGKWFRQLSTLSPAEIRSLSNTTEGRSDILTAGALTLFECMTQLRFENVLVSERGLRYGMALREWEKQPRTKNSKERIKKETSC